ncbi:hypothetical protein AB0469_31840 [Streptomyces sp. NPDC093801]|uniref:hypothetical protein n=1 Tax=Streptomyces sp. NPDC093801 TaxID=3155203 RepID=UPI00344DA899
MNAPTSHEWIRAAAARLTLGSQRLTAHLARRVTDWVRGVWQRTTRWLGEASGIAWALRLAVLLGAAWILRKVGLGVAGWGARRLQTSSALLWPALGLWLIAAWRVGHPDWNPCPAPAVQEPEPEAEPEPVSLAKEHAVAGPGIDDVVAVARTLGTPHVHLAAIEEYLGAPQGTARRLLAAAGIPIADVRMHGRGTSTGVRGSDIPPFSHPSPEEVVGVVGAGQGANNSNNDAIGVREEAGMTIITDPSERREYTV